MFREEDARIFETMTGKDVAPEEFMTEYLIRLRMFHRAGGSGSLGIVGMLDLCRSQGIGPPDGTKDNAKATDWRKVPISTKVRAVVNGKWVPGYFKGIAGSGTLAVLLDGDTVVREFGGTKVSLAPLEVPDVPDLPMGRKGRK